MQGIKTPESVKNTVSIKNKKKQCYNVLLTRESGFKGVWNHPSSKPMGMQSGWRNIFKTGPHWVI